MTDIDKLIKDYLDSWVECYHCNHMIKEHILIEDNNGHNSLCKECFDDTKWK